MRALGWSYPAVMLLTVVGTGNHFFFDAAAGGIVMAAGYVAAKRITAAVPARDWQARRESAVAPC